MRKSIKEKDVKEKSEIIKIITPVFPGEEKRASKASSQCTCACYCTHGTDQTATDLRTYDTYRR